MTDHLPNRLWEWRVARGLTQVELASMVKCSNVMIHQLETGKRGLRLRWMIPLGKALGVPIAQLLAWKDNPNSLTPNEWLLIERYRAGTDRQKRQIQQIAAILCEPN